MLTHNLMACYATTLTELRKESKKRKRTTLRQKENRHGWRIRRQSPIRNDMGHSQRVESDTLTESQSVFSLRAVSFGKITPRQPEAHPTNVPRQGIAPREH